MPEAQEILVEPEHKGPRLPPRLRRLKADHEQMKQAFGDIVSGRALRGEMTGDAQRFMEAGGFSGRLNTTSTTPVRRRTSNVPSASCCSSSSEVVTDPG